MIEIIETDKATVCFSAPTGYRAMEDGADLSSLKAAISAGKTLPGPIYDAWQEKTGKPVGGYEAKVVVPGNDEIARVKVGHLAVRGPTGCRYLGGHRQQDYVLDGWNITCDAFLQEAEGYSHFAARNDDMIVSFGYNIAGPEVVAALLAHNALAECAVIGLPDEDRGAVVEAHVVLGADHAGSNAMAECLQEHVKRAIAPYKYPRQVVLAGSLPKTATGKIQRFRLRST